MKMQQRRVKKGEIPQIPEYQEEESEDIVEETDEKIITTSLSYLDKINEFITRNDLLEVTASYYLYKFDHPTSGEGKAFIAKYADTMEAPDEDTIGKTFGSGRYLVMVSIPVCAKAPKGYGRAYRIRIHPFYDQLKNKVTLQENAPVQSQAPTIIQQPGNSLTESISLIKELIGAIAPLMAQRNDSMPDLSGILLKNYELTSEVLKKNMLESVKTNSELQRKMLSVENQDDMRNNNVEVDEQEPSIIEQLKPFIEQFLPMIIGNNQQAKKVQQMVRSAPQFKKIVNNKREFKTLIAYLDHEKGKEITDEILKKLNLSRA